jgi:iron complex outermembrane receptor protein
MKSIGRWMLAAGAVGWSAFLTAADPKADRLHLAEELVVASPIIEGDRATTWGGMVTTVSAKQIENLNAYDLAAALRHAPGVTISQYNRVGSFGGGEGGAVFVRGMGSSRPGGEIVLRIDGVPVGNPVWNHPLLDLSVIGPASHIDVYKGPQPAVFGNAFSAVDIVPKSWTSKRPGTRLSLAYGNDSTWHQGFETGGLVGPVDYVIGQSFARSDGHRPESNGRLSEIHGRVGLALDEHWRLAVFGLATDSMANDPGELGDPSTRDGCYETSEWLGTITLSHDYDRASGAIKFFMTKGNGDWYDQVGSADDTLNDWTNYGLRLHEDIRPWEGSTVRAGLDYDANAGKCTFTTDSGGVSYFDEETLRILSPYLAVAQLVGDKAGWWMEPSAGLRYYKHNIFAESWAPQAGLTFGHDPVSMHLSYSRGVVYPGLNVIIFSEDVIPGLGDSWKDLDPETVDHFEGGLTWQASEIATLGLTLFYDEGDNRYVFSFPGPSWSNIGSFRQRGGELTATVRPAESLSLFGGVTYLDPDPGDLPYCPEWTIAGGANWRFHPAFELSVDVEWVDRMHVLSQARMATAVNNETVGAHLVVNAKLTYSFTIHEKVEGKVFVALENLLDEDYEYQPNYPMPGISAMTGLEVSF